MDCGAGLLQCSSLLKPNISVYLEEQDNIKEKINLGRRTAYSLIGAGFHSINELKQSVLRKESFFFFFFFFFFFIQFNVPFKIISAHMRRANQ